MVTQCTVCRVWFRISREQLRAAHGLARCSQCGTVFNALATLRHDPPHEGARDGDSAELAAEDDEPPSLEAGRVCQTVDFLEPQSDGRDACGVTSTTKRVNRWAWRLACLVLLGALATQVGYRFVGVGSLNRMVSLVTGSQALLDRLSLRDYQLTATATELGNSRFLDVNATLRNRSRADEPLPLLALRLTNLNGRVIGSRILSPKAYDPDHRAYLAGTHTLKVDVKVADPGSAAVGFSLSLCKKIRVRVYCLP